MPGKVTVAQGEMVGRPSFLHVEVEAAADSWAISVAGGVRIVGEGAFDSERQTAELAGVRRLLDRVRPRRPALQVSATVSAHGDRSVRSPYTCFH